MDGRKTGEEQKVDMMHHVSVGSFSFVTFYACYRVSCMELYAT